MVVVAKKFVYIRRFDGEPKPTDFRLEEETLTDLKDGGNFAYFPIFSVV
jgi:hypothetical protein